MNVLKLIFLTIGHLAKQAWMLPQTLAITNKQKRQRTTQDNCEAERLDRLRNPSKYLGRWED